MVSLRKDVKVGFVVGGVMIAVVGVYFALSLLTGHGAKSGMEAVTLHPTPSESPKIATGTAPKPMTPAKSDATVAKNDRPSTPVAPAAVGGDDVWSNAFTTGDLHPTRSVTPDLPTKTSRESAAKPSDVIRAMNDPSGTAAPSEPTASAIDNTSGSLMGGSTSTLTRTPAGKSDAKPSAAVDGASKTHIVVAGETLSAIADEEYGSKSLYDLIEKANPGVDAGKLKVGQSLTIPPHEKAAAGPAAAAAKPAANVDATKQYVVKPGDSLHKIAATLYGDSGEWQAIYDANKQLIGESPANIKVGMTLLLPKAPTKK